MNADLINGKARELLTRRSVRVDSVSEAVAVAQELKNCGSHDLFRGQSAAEWHVTSSAERLDEAARDAAFKAARRFAAWAARCPEMRPYRSNTDAVWAIAQHYGMETPFIDFTNDPRIAAFFACASDREMKDGQESAIICLHTEDFDSFWKGPGMHLLGSVPNSDLPEIVHIDVQNLWRLQMQRGCFLWSPVFDIESFYDFDRIVFPRVEDDPCLPRWEEIYPLDQSSLERTLTRFFMDEHMREGNERAQHLPWTDKIEMESSTDLYQASSWCVDGIRPSDDWTDQQSWNHTEPEGAEDTLYSPAIIIKPRTSIVEVLHDLAGILTAEYIADHRGHGLHFSAHAGSEIHENCRRVIMCIRRLWNGMRQLPYTDSEIASALSVLFSLLGLECSGKLDTAGSPFESKPFGPNSVYVEFAPSPDGLGAYSRGHMSGGRFLAACNPAFLDAGATYADEHNAGLQSCLLRLPAQPKERFTFAGFRDLLVYELIPSQVLWRGCNEGDEALKVSIFFSPTEINVFGLP